MLSQEDITNKMNEITNNLKSVNSDVSVIFNELETILAKPLSIEFDDIRELIMSLDRILSRLVNNGKIIGSVNDFYRNYRDITGDMETPEFMIQKSIQMSQLTLDHITNLKIKINNRIGLLSDAIRSRDSMNQ